MNTRYETGNVIRNATTFGDYKFPNELPTEEWAGNEVRTYQNYIRPVANLFENDRENLGLIKDIYKSLNPLAENAVISGCDVVKTGNYYEVKHGAFVKGGVLYHIYPACEAVAKQIESEYMAAGKGELRLKIEYDNDKYSYSSTQASGNNFTTAVALISDILTNLGLSDTVDSHIILPIFSINENTSIFFDGTNVKTGTPVSSDVLFATITSGSIDNNAKTKTTIDGSRIATVSGYKIKNDSLANNTITIGSTVIALGSSSADFAGVNTINGVNISSTSGLSIAVGSSAKVATTANYTLGNACEKTFSSDASLAETGKLPTAEAVKTYVDNQIQNAGRNGTINFNAINVSSTATFAEPVSLGPSSRLVSNNTADASRASGAVSGSASIYTEGGIEAKGNIYSDKDIVGMNNGTYSLRSLKENITPFRKSAVKLINDVKVVNYNYIADVEKNPKVGFIADDTDELFSTKNHNIMDQSNCIGILLKAVQELSNEVKKLKEEINDLKSDSGKE